MSPFQKHNLSPVSLFAGLSPGPEPPRMSCRGIVSIRSCTVNGTAVLEQIEFCTSCCCAHRYWPRSDCLDTPTGYSVAWKIALGRRSSVVERGSHNP